MTTLGGGGRLLRAGTEFVGKAPHAADFNTIDAREAYFSAWPPEAAATWWIDDELTCVGARHHNIRLPDVPGGSLPNRTFFAPFDWPRKGQLLRARRVVRVLVSGSNLANVYYPGDPDFDAITDSDDVEGGYHFHKVPGLLYDTFGAAIRDAVAGTDVLFALHQPWSVEDAEWGGLSRFLRPLAPPADEGLVTDDVLTLVFLFEAWSELISLLPFPEQQGGEAWHSWNFARLGGGPYCDVGYPDTTYPGLNATFTADIGPIIDAYPRYGRSRTILYSADPGTAYIPAGPDYIGNDGFIEDFETTAANNALQLADMVSALGAYGFEDGGVLDPFNDDPADLVALVMEHFGLS